MDEELAYLAGFFDGEGCVSIKKSGDKYGMAVEVTQLNPSPLIRLQGRFGGRVFRKRDKRGYRTLFAWQIVASGAAKALSEMRPYLDGKADEADAALAFQQRVQNPLESRADELAARYELFERCRDLKQRTYDDVVLPETPITPANHKVRRLRWAKPKPPVRHRHRVAVPVLSTQREGRPRKGESRRPVAGELEGVYRECGLSDTARVYGVSRQTILNWLDRYGIAKSGRTPESEARRKAAAAASWKELP